MSKQNQWVAWIGVTAVLLWFLFKPKKAVAAAAPSPGSSFATPQTGAAITSAGAAQAAAQKPTILGQALSGLQNLLNRGGSNSSGLKLPNLSAGAGGGGGGGNPLRPASKVVPDDSTNDSTKDSAAPTLVWDPTVRDMFDDGFNYNGSAPMGGFPDIGPGLTYDPGADVSETPWTEPTISEPDPGHIIGTEPDPMPSFDPGTDPGGELQAAPVDSGGGFDDNSDFGGY